MTGRDEFSVAQFFDDDLIPENEREIFGDAGYPFTRPNP